MFTEQFSRAKVELNRRFRTVETAVCVPSSTVGSTSSAPGKLSESMFEEEKQSYSTLFRYLSEAAEYTVLPAEIVLQVFNRL